MKLSLPTALCAVIVLCACADHSNIQITHGSQAVQTKSRNEPIFYNGKHYMLAYSYNSALNVFDVKVTGTTAAMKASDQKDAVAIATSSLGHFACPDGQHGKLAGDPQFAAGSWALQARCG